MGKVLRASRLAARVATLRRMRFLGIDLGHKRIGLAVSDEAGEFAFPSGTLQSRGRKKDLASLCDLIREKQIGAAVIGLPIHLDGRKGPEAEKTLAFAEALSHAAGIPVEALDERWTSKEAERLSQGRSKKKRREMREAGGVDEVAASILLRTFLDRRSASPDGHGASLSRPFRAAQTEHED